MTVRAKFKLISYETTTYPRQNERIEMRTLKFMPVYDQTPGSENHTFWKATPNGEIKLGTINPEAWQQFELDGEYYIDFTRAE